MSRVERVEIEEKILFLFSCHRWNCSIFLVFYKKFFYAIALRDYLLDRKMT